MIPAGEFLLLIDASSYAHRAYHAATKTVRRSDGIETGMIINFCWSLMKLLRLNRTAIGRPPTHAAIIMDSRGKTYRHGIFPEYKAQRPAYEAALEAQLKLIPAAADAFNVPCVMVPGWEADDVIATYARLAQEDMLSVVIGSSDKDLCGLVSGSVFMYDAMKDRDPDRFANKDAMINIDAVREKWKVFPWEMADLQALAGDAVDNIPGAKGIGPVKAAALINRFGDLNRLLAEADWGGEEFPNAKDYDRIVAARDEILLSRELVTLRDDVPVPIGVDDLRLRAADTRKLESFFMELEAPQLARRVL